MGQNQLIYGGLEKLAPRKLRPLLENKILSENQLKLLPLPKLKEWAYVMPFLINCLEKNPPPRVKEIIRLEINRCLSICRYPNQDYLNGLYDRFGRFWSAVSRAQKIAELADSCNNANREQLQMENEHNDFLELEREVQPSLTSLLVMLGRTSELESADA